MASYSLDCNYRTCTLTRTQPIIMTRFTALTHSRTLLNTLLTFKVFGHAENCNVVPVQDFVADIEYQQMLHGAGRGAMGEEWVWGGGVG